MKKLARWYPVWVSAWAYCLSHQMDSNNNGYIVETDDEGLVVEVTPDCQLY